MSLVLQGATSGSITLQEPAVAGTTTINLPATSGTALVAPTALTVPNTTGTVMVSGNMPTFSAYSTTTQNPTSAVATKVILNNEEWDTANAFDSTTNYRFTPQVAGYYQIDAMLRVTASSAILNGWLAIYKNGSIYKRASELGNANVMTNAQLVLSEMVYLNGSTDYIELYGYIQGTSPSFDNANGQPYNARMAGFLVRTA